MDDEASEEEVNKIFGEVHRQTKTLKSVQTINKESQEYYSTLSKLGKYLEKSLLPDIREPMKELFEPINLDDKTIHEGIAQHLLHAAQFETYHTFVVELKEHTNQCTGLLPKNFERQESGFKDLHTITEALTKHDVGPALKWFDKLPESLQEIHSYCFHATQLYNISLHKIFLLINFVILCYYVGM